MTLWDHLENITLHKKYWGSLTEEQQKTASMFMISRYISMEYNYISIVNEFQMLEVSNEQLYNLYISVIPKQKKFFKYIKKSTKETKGDIVELLAEVFKVGEREAKDYLQLLDKKQIKELELQVKGFKDKKK